MPNLSNFQIPPPANWQAFESLCRDLWSHIWNDPYAKKNGRNGQGQNGVDIWGRPNQGSEWAAIQCKGKNRNYGRKVTKKELVDEVKKALKFQPELSHWILVTTGEKDVAVEQKAREITAEHLKAGLFVVDVLGWDDIVDILGGYSQVIKKHYEYLDANPFIEPKIDEISDNTKEILRIVKKSEENNQQEEPEKHPDDKLINLPAGNNFLELHLDKIYQGEVDYARDLINNFQLSEAIGVLTNIKSRVWDSSSPIIKFRILANLGWTTYQLEKFNEASRYFLEAFQYNPDDERALINVSLGSILVKDFTKAEDYGLKVLEKNPANTTAYAVLLQLPKYSNSLQASLEFVPDYLHEKSDIAFVFGLIARKNEKLDEAIYWFEKAEANNSDNNPNIKGALATALLESLFSIQSEVVFGQINENSSKTLNRIDELYTSAWDKIKNSPLKETHYHWIINRSIVKRIKKDYEGAKEDLGIVKQIAPDDPNVYKHSSIIEFTEENYAEAESLLERILDSDKTPEASLILTDVLMAQYKNDEAIELLKNVPKRTDDPRINKDAKQLLIENYTLLGKSEEAEAIYKELVNQNQNNIELLTASAQILFTEGKNQSAIDSLKQAKEQINSKTPFKQISDLANEFFRLKEFTLAAECLRFISDVDENTALTRMLLRCYYEAGNYIEVFKICKAVRDKHGVVSFFIAREANAYEEINDLHKAIELYKLYLNEFPNNLEINLQIAWLNYRLFNFEEVDNFLETPISLEEINLTSGSRFVYLYTVRNRLKEGFDLMYELRRKFFNDPNAHLFYVTTFFNNEKGGLVWLQNEKVDVNSAVCLIDQGGKKEWFLIENRKDINLQQNELSPNHEFAKELIGKRKNDEIETGRTNVTKEISKIDEIKSRYVYALHETMENFEKWFPKHGGLFQMYVGKPEDSEESNEHSQKFFDLVTENSKRNDEIIELYKQRKLTIGSFAELVGKSSFVISNDLRFSHEINFICADGTHPEFNAALTILSGSKKKLVADITSLQLIYDLEIKDQILSHFGRILVSPTTTDLLQQEKIETTSKKRAGFSTVGKKNNQFYFVDHFPEEIEKRITYLEEFLSWILVNCVISPEISFLDFPRATKNQMREMIQAEFLDTIFSSNNSEFILFSEDERLRNFAKSEFGLEGIWTQPLLIYLMNQNVINSKQYAAAISMIASQSYVHIQISSQVIVEAAIKSDWLPQYPFINVINRLGFESSEINSTIQVAVDFLFEMYKESIMPERQNNLTIILLDILTKNRKKSVVLKKLRPIIMQKFKYLPFEEDRIISIINSWERSRIIH